MITLIQNADVYAPAPMGLKDILIAGNKILAVQNKILPPSGFPYIDVFDAAGLIVTPGFVDGHVHIAGGGGEGGYIMRTPELPFTAYIKAGITTIIGLMGTDGITRTPRNLVARAKAINALGLTCKILTGCYQMPTPTITGTVESDICLIEEVIGVGEIAVSDHRSSQPSMRDLKKLAASARMGGLLSGKAGVLVIHLGDGEKGLSPIAEITATTEIPMKHFILTHINRNPGLFEQGLSYARSGGFIDMTAGDLKEIHPFGKGLKTALTEKVPVHNITLSSDGGGSLPTFNERGELESMKVADPGSLLGDLVVAVSEYGIPLETALLTVTQNPARILKLPGKGMVAPQMDADLLFLEKKDLSIDHVMAMGNWMIKDRTVLVTDVFE